MRRVAAHLFLFSMLACARASTNPVEDGPPLPLPVHQFVAAAYPGSKVVEAVAGDLNGDGASNHVLLLNVDEGLQQQLLVLGARAGGRVELVSASRPFGHCHHGREIWIQRKSVYVHCFHSRSFSMFSHWTYQFAMRKGRMQLIGEESYWEETKDGQPVPGNPLHFTSTNYLTGEEIQSDKVNGRVVLRKKTVLPEVERRPKFLEDFAIQ